ncbi:membrane protein [Yersinia pseudotuberculosis]|nr:membrane protein [Yersinia pseudotuberculosis]
MVFVVLWFAIAGLSEYLVWGYPLLAVALALFFCHSWWLLGV